MKTAKHADLMLRFWHCNMTTLCVLVSKLMSDDADQPKILILSFTTKAEEVMKQRI